MYVCLRVSFLLNKLRNYISTQGAISSGYMWFQEIKEFIIFVLEPGQLVCICNNHFYSADESSFKWTLKLYNGSSDKWCTHLHISTAAFQYTHTISVFQQL